MTELIDRTEAGASYPARALGVGVAAVLGTYLLITSTVTLSQEYWLFDVKRYLELWLLVLIPAALLAATPLRNAFAQQVGRIPRWMAALLLAILTLGVVSSNVNSNSALALVYSLADVALMTLLVLGALSVAACRAAGGPAFDQVALLLLAMLGTAVGVQELLGVLAALSSGIEFHPRVALLHFSWPRFYNQVQGWCMPLIAALPFVIRGKFSVKLLCVAALALNWYVLIATGGRATTLGVVFAIAFVTVVFPVARRTLLRYSLFGLVAGAGIYALVVLGHQQLVGQHATTPVPTQSAPPAARPGVEGRFTDAVLGERMKTSSGRIDIWRSAWRDGREHRVLGIGPMNYACKGPIYREGHPHSFPIQTLVEWGLPVFAMVFVIAVTLFLRMVMDVRRIAMPGTDGPLLQVALVGALVAAAVISCLDGVLVMPESQVTGMLVCGWLLGALPVRDEPRAARGIATGVLILALSASLALVSFATQELRVSAEHLEETPLMDRLIPRFWQNGKVCALYQATD